MFLYMVLGLIAVSCLNGFVGTPLTVLAQEYDDCFDNGTNIKGSITTVCLSLLLLFGLHLVRNPGNR